MSYTLSKATDDASGFFTSAGDPNFPQNSYNVAAERGRSNFDVRHRLSVSYSWALPFGKNRKYLDDNGLRPLLRVGDDAEKYIAEETVTYTGILTELGMVKKK